jgi:hypothetical protein
MKYYIDCVSGYSFLVENISKNEKMNEISRKFQMCFTNGSVKSECGRNVIEIRDLFKNISDLMETLDGKDYVSIRKILSLTLKGIAEIPGNCADNAYYYEPKKNYELSFCDTCFQMTNHLDGVCQKHKR